MNAAVDRIEPRRDLPGDFAIWIFILAVPLACAFPPHVPFVPKLMPLFPALWLAPHGVLRLLRPRRSISASTSEVAGRSSVRFER